MTTKEIAAAVGKSERRVQEWAKKTGAKIASIGAKIASVGKSGIPADYTLEETLAIIEQGMGANAAAVFRANAQGSGKNVVSSMDQVGSSLSQRDLDLVSAIVSRTVAMTIQQLDVRMSTIESRIEKRQELLPAPEMDQRSAITKLVREEAQRSGRDYQEVYRELYTQFGYRTHSDPRRCAENRGVKVIDYIESQGQLGTLLSLAVDLWKVVA